MANRRRLRSPPPSLPIEIIRDVILVRLPTKPLLRCRSVSKLWCSVIDEPSFASAHYKNCQNNQDKCRFLVLEPADMVESKQICAIRNNEKFRKTSNKVGIDVTWFEHYQAAGYINGLLCMKRYVSETQLSRIFLWNPSIRKALTLPLLTLEDKKSDIDCAFGYDHVENDYKIVASHFVGIGHVPKNAEIFTFSTFSWKTVDISNGPCLWIKGGPKIFLNGIIYWGGVDVVSNDKGRFSYIVSFDVVNETFKYIDVPNYEHNNVRAQERFPINLDQSLGMFENFESYSQIWILEDKAQSWTLRFKINLDLLCKCLYFKMDGELLFAGERGGVMSYNIKSEETKVLAKSYRLSPVFTSVYMESLALLNGVPAWNSETFPPPGVAQI